MGQTLDICELRFKVSHDGGQIDKAPAAAAAHYCTLEHRRPERKLSARVAELRVEN